MKELILLVVILFLLDCLIIKYLYRLLFGFLVGQKNKKSATNILNEQSIKDRLTLNFIKDYLKNRNRKKEFSFIQKLYIVNLTLLLPIYLCIALCALFFWEKTPIVLSVFLIIKVVEFFLIRLQFDANRIPYSASK